MANGLKLEVQIDGLAPVLEGIEHLEAELHEAVMETTKQDMRDVASLLANYPPTRSGSKYVRTGDLGLGWLTAQVEPVEEGAGLAFALALNNEVEYAGFVQGGITDDPRQARIHQGVWMTTDQALAETDDRAEKNLDDAIQRVLDKI